MRKNLLSAILINEKEISVIYMPSYKSIDDVNFYLCWSGGNKVPLKKEINQRASIPDIKLTSENPIVLGHDYHIETSEEESIYLDLDEYVMTSEFDEKYSYEENDLGCSYQKEKTTFKLWSPVSNKVFLKLEKKKESFDRIEMQRGDKGVFSITVDGDLENKKYSYIVKVNGREKEIVDPYGKAVSLNSKYSAVIDLNKVAALGIVKPTYKMNNYNDAVIYELHIRDFTDKTKQKNRGTYLGLIDKIPYLKKLGITHVQILPVIDFANVDDIKKDTYNWGYDPISFFALEGSYSLHPDKPLERLLEFKTLVNELHKNNIRVVMDVVYNHLYDYKTTDFQKNVPYYYFRTYKNKMCNASGCGNDIATERKMVRKIIVDSAKYFVNTFDVDGFRFDLLGLIDVDTTNEIIKSVKEIKEDAILYGEGWHMSTNLPEDKKSSMLNADKMPGMAFFNDTFRDLIKGSTFNVAERGYISGNLDYKNQVELALTGSVISNKFKTVNQSINYIECHDNMTLYDKLSAIHEDEQNILKRIKFANALTILSLGIPFIHMGQEIGLTKFSLDNTYNIKDVNSMDWDLVEKRKEMVDYISEIIKLRKTLAIFKLDGKEKIAQTLDCFQLQNGVLTIAVRDPEFLKGHKKALWIINPTDKAQNVTFDDYFKMYLMTTGVTDKELFIKNYMSPSSSMILFLLD